MLDRRRAEVMGAFRDDGGELLAARASAEVISDVRHVRRRCLAVEHERQDPAHPVARPADYPAQLVPLRAGVCGVALSRRRMRLSHELMLGTPSVFGLVDRALRASSECIAAWASARRSSCRRRAMSWFVQG
jgi:hypothetical protein